MYAYGISVSGIGIKRIIKHLYISAESYLLSDI